MDIIGIIIFIAYSIYRASEQAKKKQAQAQRRMTKTQEPTTPLFEFAFEEEETVETERTITLTEENLPNKYLDQIFKLDKQKKQPPIIEKEKAQIILASKDKKPAFAINNKTLVNGIIMSEVLNPPRAKRPYQLP